MAKHKEHLNKNNVKELLKKAVINFEYNDPEAHNLLLKQRFLELSETGHIGKWFCPSKLQGIINTFPPVWNFNPNHYSFKYLEDLKFDLYLSGSFLEKGLVDYYLGTVQVFNKNENGFITVMCL